MSKSWREKLRPIMLMSFLCFLVAVYIFIDNADEITMWTLLLWLGMSLLFVDLEVNKLKTRLDKLEISSAPPETEEA